MLEISPSLHIPEDELHFSFARSSGPGGQNVNKVASKALLRWNPGHSSVLPPPVLERLLKLFPTRITTTGDIVITSELTRDQRVNIEDCREKLAQRIRAALVVPKKRRATKPSRGAQRRRLQDKRENAERKQRRQLPPGGGD
ncbi:MAG: alternative ribosome rescue aminoacyl-tRNA hydrolase ArfB [Planctomycetaceae bacterium]